MTRLHEMIFAKIVQVHGHNDNRLCKNRTCRTCHFKTRI